MRAIRPAKSGQRQASEGQAVAQPTPEILRHLRQRAALVDARVLLAEGEDPRVLAAAAQAARSGLCRPILIGNKAHLHAAALRAGVELPSAVEVIDPTTDERRSIMVARQANRRQQRGLRPEVADDMASDPFYYSAMVLADGRAEGLVMGAVATTAETLRTSLRIIGVAPRYQTVTSCFLMALPDGRVLVYADCGVVPQPTPEQLVEIAEQAAETYLALVGDDPRVALLSFSTKGSARHPAVDAVRRATELLAERSPSFAFDGELQADAALVADIGRRKAPDSEVAGNANILVFPDLNSGNIAYKLTERLAGARAIGPLLCGLAQPVHDLSRGCSTDDILDTMAITALDAEARRNR